MNPSASRSPWPTDKGRLCRLRSGPVGVFHDAKGTRVEMAEPSGDYGLRARVSTSAWGTSSVERCRACSTLSARERRHGAGDAAGDKASIVRPRIALGHDALPSTSTSPSFVMSAGSSPRVGAADSVGAGRAGPSEVWRERTAVPWDPLHWLQHSVHTLEDAQRVTVDGLVALGRLQQDALKHSDRARDDSGVGC